MPHKTKDKPRRKTCFANNNKGSLASSNELGIVFCPDSANSKYKVYHSYHGTYNRCWFCESELKGLLRRVASWAAPSLSKGEKGKASRRHTMSSQGSQAVAARRVLSVQNQCSCERWAEQGWAPTKGSGCPCPSACPVQEALLLAPSWQQSAAGYLYPIL